MARKKGEGKQSVTRKTEGLILAKALEGRASLEYYPDEKRTIFAFKLRDNLTFWIDFSELKQIVADFEEVANIKLK